MARRKQYMFQSTPPHGERLIETEKKLPMIEFQSTPPHGERHKNRNDFCN